MVSTGHWQRRWKKHRLGMYPESAADLGCERKKNQEDEEEPGERRNKEEVERAEGDALAPDELSKMGSGRCAKCWSWARALK